MCCDKDFPDMGPNAKNLVMAPKDLGMSRADLWAFSGLVSLAWYQKNSRDLARLLKPTYVKTNLHLVSRNFLKTESSNFLRLVVLIVIQEIRMTSCTSTDLKVGNFILVLDSMARGPWNMYFKKGFNLEPSEATALMGAHTVGFFNGVNSKIDYAWVDSEGNCNSFKFPWGFHLKDKIPDPKNKPECK